MRSIITPEAVESGKHMLSAKWIDCSKVLVAVSPAAECDCMISDTTRINGIKMRGCKQVARGMHWWSTMTMNGT